VNRGVRPVSPAAVTITTGGTELAHEDEEDADALATPRPYRASACAPPSDALEVEGVVADEEEQADHQRDEPGGESDPDPREAANRMHPNISPPATQDQPEGTRRRPRSRS